MGLVMKGWSKAEPGYLVKRFRTRLRLSIRWYRRTGKYDLSNATNELLTAFNAGYPVPRYQGLGDACLKGKP